MRPGTTRALRAVILMDQAVRASHAGNLRDAIRTAELILELAGRAGDKALEAQCCAGLAFATFMLGNGLRPDLISRALAGPPQSPRLSMELRPNVAVGHILHWTDDLDGARVLYEQEYALAVEQGVRDRASVRALGPGRERGLGRELAAGRAAGGGRLPPG